MITVLHRIKCDHCGHGVTDEFDEGEEYARKVMRNFGWSEDGEGDMCPDCAMKSGNLQPILIPESRFKSGRFASRILRFTLDGMYWYEGWYRSEDDTFRSESSRSHPGGAVAAKRQDCKMIAFCNRSV